MSNARTVDANREIIRYRGDTYPLKIRVQDSNGVAVDITGWSFLMTINSENEPSDSSNQLGQITGVITSAANGEVEFPFTTVSLTTGTSYWDIQATDNSSYVTTLQKGVLTTLQDITK